MPVHPYQLTFDGHDGAGNPWLCTAHYLFDDSTYATTFNAAQDLLNSWDTACRLLLKVCFGTDIILYNETSQAVSPIGGFKAINNVNQPGTGGGLSTVGGLSMNIELRVGSAPYHAGHMYLPGCEQGSVIDSTWAPAYLTTVDAFASVCFNAITLLVGGGTAQPIVYSRARTTPVVVPASWKNIVGFSKKPKPTLMGRRLLPQL